MACKYIFVLGGVVSGLGKGITAASLGRLLKSRGLKVTMQKLDPYLNRDPGRMNPIQHGEVFVTEDGAETDLDVGHYERFIDENLNKHSNVTSGKIYFEVLENERKGVYAGSTVQMIPHITNTIQDKIRLNAKSNKADVAIVEVGGTVGDYESLPFLEAIRQFSLEEGYINCMYIHVALVPFITPSNELKTKPVQHSVKELLSLGIQPDVLVCRSDRPIGIEIKQKLSLFCNVKTASIIENINAPSLYEVPLALEEEGLATQVIKRLRLRCKEKDLSDWIAMVEMSKQVDHQVTIGLVGKYTELKDAYLSVVESLYHAGIFTHTAVDIRWIDAETITPKTAKKELKGLDGILIPGGFGVRGTEGKIETARYARENKIPFLGICLGMQIATIEYARNVAGLPDAGSIELDPKVKDPVIHVMGDADPKKKIGTLKLGSYPVELSPDSHVIEAYGTSRIDERHRHRYAFNLDYLDQLKNSGLKITGLSPDGEIVEVVEVEDHPWYVACQYHPEFKSRPNRPHPLFLAYLKAVLENQR